MIDLIFFLQGDDDTYHFDRLTDTRTSTWKEGRMGSSSQVSGLGRLLHVPTCISRYIPTITGHSGLPPCRMNDLCLTLVRRDRFSHLALESQTTIDGSVAGVHWGESRPPREHLDLNWHRISR
jgi:hypothetical protein